MFEHSVTCGECSKGPGTVQYGARHVHLPVYTRTGIYSQRRIHQDGHIQPETGINYVITSIVRVISLDQSVIHL